MTERSACDLQRLRLLLANEIRPELEAEAIDHIVECASCRKTLESLAGDQDWWTEVKTCLTKNADSMAARPRADFSGTSNVPDQHGEEHSFATDFAVDFLAPCERPDALGGLDDIEILEVIGWGGMGVILKGFQPELGRYVAVKVMAPHLAASGSARKRFTREARAAAAIVHPHVMAIHSVNSSGRLPYLVMPFVACESLQQRLDREGPLELKEILRIGRQVAAGLAAAHAQGLVHRDVKPANILLEKGVDRVMLTDFGLARAADDATLTKTGVIAGTPQYMSPEQARGEAVDHRSDLFSLGSVMYAMCTGRPPFRAETSYGILRRITDNDPRSIREVNPDIPEWLETVVTKLQGKDIEERFDSADEFSQLMERCLAHVQQPTAVSLPEEVGERFKPDPCVTENNDALSGGPAAEPEEANLAMRRRIVFAVVISVVLVAVIVGQGILGWINTPELPQDGEQGTSAGEQTDTANPAGDGSDDASPNAVWKDQVGPNIQEMELDLGAFEKRAGHPWEGEVILGD